MHTICSFSIIIMLFKISKVIWSLKPVLKFDLFIPCKNIWTKMFLNGLFRCTSKGIHDEGKACYLPNCTNAWISALNLLCVLTYSWKMPTVCRILHQKFYCQSLCYVVFKLYIVKKCNLFFIGLRNGMTLSDIYDCLINMWIIAMLSLYNMIFFFYNDLLHLCKARTIGTS